VVHEFADKKKMANPKTKGKEMNEDSERPITLDDVIEATKDMNGTEYRDFMELPIEKRIEIAKEILKKNDNCL